MRYKNKNNKSKKAFLVKTKQYMRIILKLIIQLIEHIIIFISRYICTFQAVLSEYLNAMYIGNRQ